MKKPLAPTQQRKEVDQAQACLVTRVVGATHRYPQPAAGAGHRSGRARSAARPVSSVRVGRRDSRAKKRVPVSSLPDSVMARTSAVTRLSDVLLDPVIVAVDAVAPDVALLGHEAPSLVLFGKTVR